jgi:tricorn protease
MGGVSNIAISQNRKQLLYQSGSTWGIIKSELPGKVGDGKLNVNMGMKIDPTSEWRQIFKEGWRFQRDFLYVDNVHGAPWDKIYEWYQPWVEHVRHRTDLNYVVDILGGEVSVGHSYTSGGDFPTLNNQEVGLLGVDYEWTGVGFRFKKILTGEQWNPDLVAPLAIPGLGVKEGDYLIEINGQKLSFDNNPHKLLIGSVGRLTQIRINSTPATEGSKVVEVTPIANEAGLRLREWVEGNRRKVDILSNGKLAYVYVPNTGQPGYTYFNRYYFGQQDKQGAVIDERNNGGGSAADYMVDVMNRPLMGYFNNRVDGHTVSTTPMSGIFGPKVMIINERAGSGGDLLPYMFKKSMIGPLIGTRTWGGLVGTWDTPRFLDGGRMVAPRGGFFDTEGRWAVEGEGISPDIEVLQDPAAVLAGKDPQLERAVQEALKLLETKGVKLKEEPAPPVRWKRPGGNR